MSERAEAPAWEGGRLVPLAAPIRVLMVGGNAEERAELQRQVTSLPWGHFEVRHAEDQGPPGQRSGLEPPASDVALLLLPPHDGLYTLRRLEELAPDLPTVVITDEQHQLPAPPGPHRGAVEYLARCDLNGAALGHALRGALERGRLLAHIHALVMRNSDAVLVVDREGLVKFANPAAERMFGRPRDRLVGEVFGFPIETRSRAEIAIVRGTDPRFAEMRVADIDWEGQPAFLATLRDITDRKRAEDLQTRLLHADRLASVGQLAAGVAHEVNNPAAFVMANLRFMQEELSTIDRLVGALRGAVVQEGGREVPGDVLVAELGTDTALRELREQLRENLYGMDRIVKIMRDLRTFSRIERDEVELCDLNDIVRVACSMTANEIRHRARLVQELRPVPLVPADRGKLAQVIINLLVNAAQAIGDGAADRNTITVQSRTEGDHVVVSIADTGPGIPELVQRRMFEPFFTTKPREHGTGLGLSLSLEIVRKHGGDVGFATELGQGSRFDVRLPIDGPMGALLVRTRGHTPGPRPARRARILVIDDEPIIINSFRRMLGKEHEVITANGGVEGLALLNTDQGFDVILCDLMMPDLDGVAVFSRIQNQWPQLTDRVVFCSGGAFTPRAKEFVSSVRNITLEKPVSWELLRGVVDRVVAGSPDEE